MDNGWGGSIYYDYDAYLTSCSNTICPNSKLRYPVVTTVAYNGKSGQPRDSVRTSYDYTVPDGKSGESSAVANDGGFLGFQVVEVTHFAANSSNPNQALKWERLFSVGGSTGADGGRDNPDPRRGRLERQEVWSKHRNLSGALLLSTTETNWQAYWFRNGAWSTTPTTTSWRNNNGAPEYPPTWVRQEVVTTTVFSSGGNAVNETRLYYETKRQNNAQYGNLTQVQEVADGVIQRTTLTEYYPNPAAYIVNRPGRVRVYNADGVCLSEVRSIYDSLDSATGSNFQQPPSKGQLTERAQALKSCLDNDWLAADNVNWQIERYQYDGYGNRIQQRLLGAAGDSVDRTTKTTYDGYYHLFPIKVYDAAQTQFAETASYYGVNLIASGNSSDNTGWGDPWAYWGAMAEWCDVNDVCVRQAYDAHARRTLRWENVPEGTHWSSIAEGDATVRWDYRNSLNDPGWNDVTVSEWHAPRCEGNFVRRHYNGFGQLTQEQRPAQGWWSGDCAGGVPSAVEVDIDYLYDGLGRQSWVSVPHKRTTNWINRPPHWDEGYTTTQYDALDRVTRTTAPNGEVTDTIYPGRQTKVTGVGRGGYSNRVLQWTETDGLGNLTGVTQPKVEAATITYDLGGRKVEMVDPDLGRWRYDYNRQGQLVRQTDANGWTTCLYYDGLGRPASRYSQAGSSCPAQNGSLQRTVYGYDGGHSASNRSRGQLTRVAKYDSNGTLTYSRSQVYDSLGRPAQQGVGVWSSGVMSTSYSYDDYSRVQTTTYPGGELVTVGYGSQGLPVRLVSSQWGVLANGTVRDGQYADAAAYDAAGRLVQVRYPAGGGLWRTAGYFPWLGDDGDSNGRLHNLLVGSGPGGSDRYRTYLAYDSFANVRTRSEFVGPDRQENYSYGYDSQNRVSKGTYRRYDPGEVLVNTETLTTTYQLQGGWPVKTETSGDEWGSLHGHFSAPGNGKYTFDANGNVRSRTGEEFIWDAENRLAQMNWDNGAHSEYYSYDEAGVRVRKAEGTSAGVTSNTYYLFPHYERKVVGSNSPVVTKYYFLGGMLIAKSANGVLTYLHSDHLGSVVLETDTAGSIVNDQRYYAYGRRLDLGGNISGEKDFTGQREDATIPQTLPASAPPC